MAIENIVLEGEGTSFTSPTDEHGQLAHYFKFLEMMLGRKILGVKQELIDGAESYKFILGDTIPFDETQVVTDSKVWNPPVGTSTEPRLLHFQEAYERLLASLQRLFDGNGEELTIAVANMRQLQIEAVQLLQPPLIQNQVYPAIAPSFDLSKLHSKTNLQAKGKTSTVRPEKEDLHKDIVHAQVRKR